MTLREFTLGGLAFVGANAIALGIALAYTVQPTPPAPQLTLAEQIEAQRFMDALAELRHPGLTEQDVERARMPLPSPTPTPQPMNPSLPPGW